MWQDVSTPWPKVRVKKRNRALRQEIADASSRAPQNPTNPLKKILSEETHRWKAKYTVKPFSLSTLPKYCRMLSLSLNLKKVERKEERDIYVRDCLLGNIADPYKYLFYLGVLKTLLYFISLLVSKFIHCVVYLSSCLLHIPSQLHSPQFILAKCPICFLKILHGKLELSTTIINIIISKHRAPYLPLS